MEDTENDKSKYTFWGIIVTAIVTIVTTLIVTYSPKKDTTTQPTNSQGNPQVPTIIINNQNGQNNSITNDNIINTPETNKTGFIKNNKVEDIVITIRDDKTLEPIPNVHVSLEGYSNSIYTDSKGQFRIPESIIIKTGTYNSIKATFIKSGYFPEQPNIGLSESYPEYLRKKK